VRTNIDIDERLMQQAMRRRGAPTKKAAVEAGLRLLIQTHSQSAIRRLKGKVRVSHARDGRKNKLEGDRRRDLLD
jgi:Arc/MetJ family transcription regulator